MAKIIRDDEPYHNIHDIIRGIVKNIESYNKELINHKNVIGQKYIRILKNINFGYNYNKITTRLNNKMAVAKDINKSIEKIVQEIGDYFLLSN